MVRFHSFEVENVELCSCSSQKPEREGRILKDAISLQNSEMCRLPAIGNRGAERVEVRGGWNYRVLYFYSADEVLHNFKSHFLRQTALENLRND